MIANYLWVDDQQKLNKALNGMDLSMPFAIDTEFERSRTYYLNPALLQMWNGQQALLIDLTKEELYSQLGETLNSIVIHSGSEDIELMRQIFKCSPAKVFDTQIAASLCGFGSHVSYQNLVKELLEIEIPKDESRTDWLQRPLTQAQIDYAVNDVRFLPELRQALSEQLQAKQMMPLFDRLMHKWILRTATNGHNEKTFTKLVKSERLQLAGQQKLWALLEWRERQAERRNKPRNWILKNDQLTQIVRYVKDKQDLKKIRLHPSFLKHNAESIWRQISQAEALAPTKLPTIVRLNSEQSQSYHHMKERLDTCCEALDIPASVIMNTSGLKELAFFGKDLESIDGWQELQTAHAAL
ncbi:ribonuclease D [Marinicella sp. W31]|uniref:ribonuclease D n=1 Tax=Marinicella sp. W31 TaxID=3023713 RepID=UPI0037563C8A